MYLFIFKHVGCKYVESIEQSANTDEALLPTILPFFMKTTCTVYALVFSFEQDKQAALGLSQNKARYPS